MFQIHRLRSIVSCYYPSDLLRTELKLDSIEVMMKKSTCKMAYKCFYNLCPVALNDMLNLYVNERELRSNEELNAILPRYRTQWAERNFAFRAVVYWNSLPLELKMSPSIDSFKCKIRMFEGFTTWNISHHVTGQFRTTCCKHLLI